MANIAGANLMNTFNLHAGQAAGQQPAGQQQGSDMAQVGGMVHWLAGWLPAAAHALVAGPVKLVGALEGCHRRVPHPNPAPPTSSGRPAHPLSPAPAPPLLQMLRGSQGAPFALLPPDLDQFALSLDMDINLLNSQASQLYLDFDLGFCLVLKFDLGI